MLGPWKSSDISSGGVELTCQGLWSANSMLTNMGPCWEEIQQCAIIIFLLSFLLMQTFVCEQSLLINSALISFSWTGGGDLAEKQELIQQFSQTRRASTSISLCVMDHPVLWKYFQSSFISVFASASFSFSASSSLWMACFSLLTACYTGSTWQKFDLQVRRILLEKISELLRASIYNNQQ